MKNVPRLITFDGEARSGKGTIVQATKDYLRDKCSYKVMLIDAGQVFRVLVVAAMRSGVDIDDAAAVDAFLSDETEAERCVRLVKDVYHMEKQERDELLYTNEVGANSAKIGKHPLSQAFKDDLLRKWLGDAANEGFEVVLLDGRALEATGSMLENEGLCRFIMGLYFVCDPVVGAMRTLGFGERDYEELGEAERESVEELVNQINARNESDKSRKVQPVVPPVGAITYKLPNVPEDLTRDPRPMLVFDTTARLTKEAMAEPVAKLISEVLEPR